MAVVTDLTRTGSRPYGRYIKSEYRLIFYLLLNKTQRLMPVRSCSGFI